MNSSTLRKIIIAVCSVVAIAIITIIVIPKQSEYPVTELERISLENNTAKYVNFIEEVDRVSEYSDDGLIKVNDFPLDSYIAYALEYNYNETSQQKLTSTEIKTLLESIFDADFNAEEINSVGITPYLLDKHISQNLTKHSYHISKDFDKTDIANIPVTKYITKSITTNKDHTVFTVTYDKYTAKNPYDITKFINSSTNISDYLKGKGKITSVKNAINEEAAKKLGDPVKQTIITYTLKDEKIIIKSIK